MALRDLAGIDGIGAVLFDLDGTVYYGSRIIPGANETIAFFRKAGVPVFLTTNNSTKSRRQIYRRLTGMGVDCQLEEVLTSGYLAALYAKQNGLSDLYIFGSDNLKEEFDSVGVSVEESEEARNLLIGYNPAMTYEGLAAAVRVALRADRVIACNRERVYPGENAQLMPGCGAMTAPVEWCAGRECDMVIGKPSPAMVDMISREHGIDAASILVVGDTFESDIAMADAAGCMGVLIAREPQDGLAAVASIAEVPGLFA